MTELVGLRDQLARIARAAEELPAVLSEIGHSFTPLVAWVDRMRQPTILAMAILEESDLRSADHVMLNEIEQLCRRIAGTVTSLGPALAADEGRTPEYLLNATPSMTPHEARVEIIAQARRAQQQVRDLLGQVRALLVASA